MKRKRYSNEQIAFALRQAENGTTVEEVCRKLGVSEATFYRWKQQFAGMGVVEIRRLKQLEECPAETAGGGFEPGQDDASGCSAPKVLTPACSS